MCLNQTIPPYLPFAESYIMSKQVSIFYSHAPTMGYVFRSGRMIHFLAGQFTTSNQEEIDELNKECAANPTGNYYVNPDQLTVDPEQLDPMAVLYAKMMEKARAEVAAAIDPNRDMGKTEQGKLEGIANSSTIRGLTADSTAAMIDSATTAQPVVAGSIKVATATASKL